MRPQAAADPPDSSGPPTEPSPAARPSPAPLADSNDHEPVPAARSQERWDQPPSGHDDPPDDGVAAAGRSAGPPWQKWILPAVLAVGAVGGAFGALMLDDHAEAEPVGTTAAEALVLSPRRVPELLIRPRAEQRLAGELDSWVTQLPSDSCLVVGEPGTPLFEHNPDLPLPGASTQKIVTTTAALLAGDPDSSFETVAASTAAPADGVLAGDLYLIGGGDPLLTSDGYMNQVRRGAENLRNVGVLAEEIADAGITHIQGSVIGDESRYDAERFHEAWPDRFRGQNQIGPVSALNVNDGFSEFPAQWAGLESKVPATDPAANAAAVITEELANRGITVDGAPTSGSAPEDAEPVASLESPPLRDITSQALMDSDNDTAEMLFKELGLEQEGTGSWEAGAKATTDILTDAGIDLEGLQIVDGSGLSEQDRLSCALLVELLTYPETGAMVVDGLAVGGESGTLADRWNGTAADGRILGKTGTLRNVSALAGQVMPTAGGTLTYAFVTTVPEPGQLTTDQTEMFEPLGEILVAHSAGVDVADLLPAGYPSDEPTDETDE